LDRTVDITPVEIAESSGPTGTPSRIIGWGLTCNTRGCDEPPAQLQELDTEVVDDAECALGQIDGATEICTGSPEPSANACFGDSGGPQLEGTPGNWRLTGVTSRLGGLLPVCATAPSIYTDATAYHDWIQQTISGSTSADSACARCRVDTQWGDTHSPRAALGETLWAWPTRNTGLNATPWARSKCPPTPCTGRRRSAPWRTSPSPAADSSEQIGRASCR